MRPARLGRKRITHEPGRVRLRSSDDELIDTAALGKTCAPGILYPTEQPSLDARWSCVSFLRAPNARNALVHVDGLAAAREGDALRKLDGHLDPTIELTAQVPEEAPPVLVAESRRGDNAQHCLPGRVLVELELPHVLERVVVHVDRGPRDR